MSETFELYKSIDIDKLGEFIKFPRTTAMSRSRDYLNSEVELLSIEIKSNLPPTDCIFQIKNEVAPNAIDIQLMKYRKDFIFENGYYILYFPEMEELRPNILPTAICLLNQRDIQCKAKLFYKLKFPERPFQL